MEEMLSIQGSRIRRAEVFSARRGKYQPSMGSVYEKQQEGRSDEYKNAEGGVQKAV